MKVSTLMEEVVYTIDEDSTVRTAAEKMGKKRIGSLIVKKEDEIKGIITERDIMSRVIAQKRSLDNVKVKEVMSTPIVKVNKDIEGEEVLKTMSEKGVGRVLVTDENKIVGIFSTSDITKLAIK
jgi:CBS domain-containing protein